MAALLEAITSPAVLDRIAQQSPDLAISYTNHLVLRTETRPLVSIAADLMHHQHDEADGRDE